MRKVLFALAAVSAVAATPALANEARVEARGGISWGSGNSEAVAGVAAGYDFDLGSSAFAGLEVSADKQLDTGYKVAFGFTGRAGAKMGNTKLYVDGGYTTENCSLFCTDSMHAGAGVEQGFGSNLYGKLAYRHYFTNNGFADSNAVVAGLGVKF